MINNKPRIHGLPFLLASFSYNFAGGCLEVALGQILYSETGSILLFACILGAEYLAPIIFGVHSGIIVDRKHPAKVGAVASIICMIMTFMLVLNSAKSDVLNTVIVLNVIFAISINLCRPFYRAAIFSIGPLVLPAEVLQTYNARWTVSVQAGQISGAGIVGILYMMNLQHIQFVIALFGFLSAFLSFLWGGYLYETLNRHTLPQNKSWIIYWKETIKILVKNKLRMILLALISADFITIAGFLLLLAPTVSIIFLSQPSWISWLSGLFSSGIIIGALLTTKLTKKYSTWRITLMGYGTQMSGLFLMVIATIIARPTYLCQFIALISSLVMGAGVALSSSQQLSQLQLLSNSSEMGRIGSLRQMAIGLGTSLIIPIVAYSQKYATFLAFFSILLIMTICFLVQIVLIRNNACNHSLL